MNFNHISRTDRSEQFEDRMITPVRFSKLSNQSMAYLPKKNTY